MNKWIVALMLLGCGLSNPRPACAACVGPTFSITVMRDSRVVAILNQTFNPAQAPPAPAMLRDATITVAGRGYTDGCHDVCINGVCPPTFPAQGVRILFIQGDKTIELGKIDADSNFQITLKTSLPADARSGQATIVSEMLYEGRLLRSQPVRFNVQDPAEIR